MAYIPSIEQVVQATGEPYNYKTVSHEMMRIKDFINCESKFRSDRMPSFKYLSISSSGKTAVNFSKPSLPEVVINSRLDAQPYCFTYSNYALPQLEELDISNFKLEFSEYTAIYERLFLRREQREHGTTYLTGLLSDIDDKSVEGIVIELISPDERVIRNMQHFISKGSWDDETILKQHWREVEKDLGHQEGVLTLDGSDFPKQGQESAGVKRQYCGQLGKQANCQAGVFVGYVSPNGYTLLDRRLYLPEEWLEEEYAEKRAKCGIPQDVTFRTKNKLGLEMIKNIVASKSLSVRWLTCDEAFGRSTAFLDEIAQSGLWYFAEVPHNTRIWTKAPQVEIPSWSGRGRKPTKKRVVEGEAPPVTVLELANSIAETEWSHHIIKEGSKGPIVADFAFRRVFGVRDGLPGDEVWLVLRRSEGEIKTYLSNAPATISKNRLVKVSGSRWPIEMCFEESKQKLGMGDYQVRTWSGWHHHMTLTILAHFFLVRLRVLFADKSPALTTPQVYLLLSTILPKVPAGPGKTLAIINYRQQRNHAAYLSHRKRRLKKLKMAA